MSELRDLLIKAWDSTAPCPDGVYSTRVCPSCLAEKLEPLLESFFADKKLQQAGQARRSDKVTSIEAAKLVKAKATTARIRLLLAHSQNPDGLIDEEASQIAGLSPLSEFRTRCSELMRAGCLEDLEDTRLSSQGIPNVVRRITALGSSILAERQLRENSYTSAN